jgi:prepilin-type N-terminal cleavage/methylation domain-containing protein
MIHRPPSPRIEPLAGQSGYTLIELLVAMVCAVVITLAAFALLEFGTRLVQQTDDRIDSSTSGEHALNAIVQGLDSSCIFPATSPIQSSTALPSGGTSLVYWSNSTGGQATVTPVLHKVSFSAGSLTETSYALSSGTTPSTWTFSSSAMNPSHEPITLATHISEVSGTPIFQYYGYSSSTGEISTTNLAASGNLTATQAASVLSVAITFSAAPYNTSTLSSQTTRQTIERRTVDLRLSPLGTSGNHVACS